MGGIEQSRPGRRTVLLIGLLCLAMTGSAGAADARAHHAGPGARAGWRLELVHRQRALLRRPSRHARAAIVGGSAIAISQAPWQVSLLVELEGGRLLCGGSVIDLSHILTAGHCVIDPETGTPVAAKDILVVAGTATLNEQVATAQVAEAEHVRIHPDFLYADGPGTPDDVAVLTLTAPLKATNYVQPIARGTGATPEGTSLGLTGFGEEKFGQEPDGLLHGLGLTSSFPRICGGEADALFICASTPSGSACSGDSGSGLTSAGAGALLLGVADFVGSAGGEVCGPGATDGFVNVAAPEIGDFIEGSESPPLAPQGGGVVIRGVPRVGSLLSCAPGSWSHAPTFTYAFMAGATVLTRGLAATYPLTSADLGRSISCEVTASNSGGSAVVRTTSLRPIEGNALPSELSGGSGGPSGPAPAPGIAGEPSALKLLSGRLTVRHGTVLASIACQGSRPCRGRLTVSVTETVRVSGHLRRRKLTIATARASLAAGAHAIVKLALDATGRSLLRAGHGRLGAQLTLLGLETASAGAVHKPVRLVRG